MFKRASLLALAGFLKRYETSMHMKCSQAQSQPVPYDRRTIVIEVILFS